MAAVELATGYVTLTVETSDLSRQVGKMFGSVEVTASKTGRNMGQAMARAFEQSKPDISSLEKQVERSQQKIVAHKESGARKVEAADRKVEISQARVNESLEKHGENSSQYLRANDQLINAKQKAAAESLSYEDSLKRLEKQLGDAESALKDAEAATDSAADSSAGAADKYAKGWRGVAQRMRDQLTGGVQTASDEAASAASAGGERAGTFWSRAMETAVGVGIAKVAGTVASKVGSFVSNAFSSGWSRLTSIDDASAKMRGFGYEAEQVELIMQNATDSVTGTAYGLDEAATVAASALAAQIKPGKELESHLSTIANMSAAAGTSMEEMGEIFNKAATQANGVQNDIIGRLADRGIPIYEELGKTLGVTAGEVFKLASEGKVDFETFAAAAEAAGGDVAAEMGKTFTGTVSLVMSSVGRIGANLWSGLFERAPEVLGNIQGWFKSLEPLAAELGDRIGDSIGGALDWISENTGTLKTLGIVLGVAAGALGTYFAITKTVAAYSAIIGWYKKFTAGQTLLNAAMSANPIGLVIAAIAALVAGFIWAYREIGWFKDGVHAVLDALGSGWSWLYENAIQPAIDGIVTAWNWLGDVFSGVWTNHIAPLFETIKGVWGSLTDAFSVAGGAIVGAWQWIAETAVSVWSQYLQPIFSGIGTVVSWLWGNIIQPYFSFMIGLFLSVGEALRFVWDNILKPVFGFFGTAAVWLWQNIVQPIFGFIGGFISAIFTGIGWAWDNILKPVFGFIGSIIGWLWNNIVRPVFGFIGAYFAATFTGMSLAWEHILKPAFRAVGAVASWLWSSVLKPTFSWIGENWSSILDIMRWAWDTILKPTWETLARVVSWLWNDVLKPAFANIRDRWDSMSTAMRSVYNDRLKPIISRFGDIVTSLKDKFKTAVDNIKKAWNGLKSVAAKPVNFVINRVLNKGLIAGFNKIVDFLPGMKKFRLNEISVPKWISEHGYATGGYTGDGHWQDAAGVVHKGEFVLRKKATAALRQQVGLEGLDYMNETGRMPGFSSGGLVQPVRGKLTSRFGARWGSQHAGVDWAVPTGTPVLAALAGTVARAAWNAVSGRTGKGILLSHPGNRNTYYGHLDAFRVAVGDSVAKGQMIGLSGNTGRSTGPHLHFETWTGGKPVDPLKYMGGLPEGDGDGGGWFDPLAPLRGLADKFGNWLRDKFPEGGFLVDTGIGLGKHAVDSVVGWAQDKLNSIGDFFTGGDSGGGSGSVQQQVKDVAAQFGWHEGSQWSALAEIVRRESSWKPGAANPSSSARGLFQLIAANRSADYRNVPAHAREGLNYIKNRFKTPSAALAHHNRMGWYDVGGLVRDSGGVVPPGSSVIHNWTNDPEWMYTDKQQDAVGAALDITKNGARGNTYHIHVNKSQASATDIAKKLEFETRRLERV